MVESTHVPPHGPRNHRHGPGSHLRDMLNPRRLGRVMARRGVRQVILAVLLEEPMHGYQVIQRLEQRSGGRWRPSAGSIYPTLQQLEDEGLVTSQELDGRRVYTLTDEGRTAAQASPLNHHPWFEPTAADLGGDLRKLAEAAMEVSRAGSPAAQERAREILVEARRQLYRILADDDAETPSRDGVLPGVPEDTNPVDGA